MNGERNLKSVFDTAVACPYCGEINLANNMSLVKQDLYTGTGYYLRVIYLQCTSCKSHIVVQVDDAKSLAIYRELSGLILKTFKKRVKKETISPKDMKKKDKLTMKLRRMRYDLKDQVKGLTLYDENKNIIIKGLTFSEEGDIIDNMQKV